MDRDEGRICPNQHRSSVLAWGALAMGEKRLRLGASAEQDDASFVRSTVETAVELATIAAEKDKCCWGYYWRESTSDFEDRTQLACKTTDMSNGML